LVDGAELRALRIRLGLTQQEVAAAARMRQPDLSAIERGRRGTPDGRRRVLDAIGSQEVVARGRDVFFDRSNHVEFSAARMTVIDLDVAADRRSSAFKEALPEIDRRALARTRDRYADHSEDIDRLAVWNLIERRFQEMKTILERALSGSGADGDDGQR
jgi:transcriptional regulator with XRE-family HTH domain